MCKRLIVLEDKEIDALTNLTALVIVQSVNANKKYSNVLSAIVKFQKARLDSEIEIPEERLAVLNY